MSVQRPAVSVLVPFAGGEAQARRLAEALAGLRLEPDDEAIIADNSPAEAVSQVELPPGWRVVPASREGSPAHTRNAAALAADRDWLLFLDSDMEPPPDLIDSFFTHPIPEEVGVIGGRVLSDTTQHSLAARWADSRGMTSQEHHVEHPYRPYLLSACMLTRRRTWIELGGFYEGIFNGEDVDFCWRAQEAGWKLELSSEAGAVHQHRDTIPALMKQAAVRGASATWVYRRWPQATHHRSPRPHEIARGIAVSPLMLAVGQAERAGLRLLDVATQLSELWGRLQANRARERPAPPPVGGDPLELWCEEFPLPEDGDRATAARRLRLSGHPVLVVAARRPQRPALGIQDVEVRYLEDDTDLERLGALLRVAARRPLAVLRDRFQARHRGGPSLRVLAPAVRRAASKRNTELRALEGDPAAIYAERAARLAGRRVWVEGRRGG